MYQGLENKTASIIYSLLQDQYMMIPQAQQVFKNDRSCGSIFHEIGCVIWEECCFSIVDKSTPKSRQHLQGFVE